MHQSVIEVGTGVCRNMQEAREDILELRRADDHAGQRARHAAGCGQHASVLSTGRCRRFIPDERYEQVVEDMQLVARANLVFGLHVHIGIEDRNTAIHIMNSMRYFLPHILALSTNSPFWMGMQTGFKSIAAKCSSAFPVPPFLTCLPTGRSTRLSSSCWSKPIASTTARRSGGTSARIHSSIRWKCACATFPCGSTRPWRSQR